MARPRIYEEPRVTTAVRLPVKLRDDLHAEARKRDVSANYLVTRAVADFLARLPPLDDSTSLIVADSEASAQ